MAHPTQNDGQYESFEGILDQYKGFERDRAAENIDEDLFERLNHLQQWRDTQQQKLISNQLTQRQLLNLEKEKLYELLGLSLTSDQNDSEISDGSYCTEDDGESGTEAVFVVNREEENERVEDIDSDSDTEECTPRTEIEAPVGITSHLALPPKNALQMQFAEVPGAGEAVDMIPKRPFLKRGEGLKNRFKVSPDAFRLENLPKYKFARKSTQALSKRPPPKKQQQQQQQQQLRRDGARGEGQPNNNNSDKTPEVKNVNKASQKKVGNRGSGSLKLKPKQLVKDKVSIGDSCNTSLNGHDDINQYGLLEKDEKNGVRSITGSKDINNGYPSTTPLFDTPIRRKVQSQQNEINELNVFEVLERRFAPSNGESTSTSTPIAKVISDTVQSNAMVDPSNKGPSESGMCLRTASIRPARCAVSQRSDPRVIEMSAEAENARDVDQLSFYSSDEEPRHVHFASHAVKIMGNNETTVATEDGNYDAGVNTSMDDNDNAGGPEHYAPFSASGEQPTESFQRFKEKLFDKKLKQKFKAQLSVAKNAELEELDEEVDDDSVFLNQSTTYEATVTQPYQAQSHQPQSHQPQSHQPQFHQAQSYQTQSHQALTADLQSKSELVQTRLTELEAEIASFKEQNAELTKLIREHEVLRLEFEEERQATLEQLNDERIKIEVYLHDENMKLVNERKELDKKAKEFQRPNRSERDEITRLREQCANHEKELNARDQKHIAAQARMRAQLRTIEKDFKEAQFDLENQRRENKKLEQENTRLRRQGNNKMLQEINKNIAKLAPLKLEQNGDNGLNNNVEAKTTEARHSKVTKAKSVSLSHAAKECSNKSAHKSVVAKVTSGRSESPSVSGRMRSKSVPNLQQEQSFDSGSERNISDAEIENGSNHRNGEKNGGSKSSYFHSSPSAKSHRSQCREGSVDRKSKSPSAAHNVSSGSNKSANYKRVIENPDGSKDVWYPNGNLKKISPDGMCIRMLYYNKDIKETNIAEGTVKYYYAETNTWHTTYLDGLEILEFPNGQTEHRFKDGTVEVHFPNGSVRITNPYKMKNDGITEEWKYPDGTSVIQKTNGDKLLLLPNGQREVHTNGHKRREYPDGTVKIVYPDGSQESRYSNGRVRLKDKDGKLVMDSETIFV